MAYLRILAGLAISAGCIAALLTQIDVGLAWSALTRANPLWLLVALAVLAATMFTKIYRWGLLYYPATGLRLRNLTSALFIGYMVLSLMPMRLGELVRAYLIGKTEPVSFAQSIGTILVEKVLDVATILLFLAGLALFGLLPPLAVPGPALAALGLVPLAGLIALAALPREAVLALLARLQRHLPGSRRWNLVKLVGPFLDALAVLRHRQLLPALACWSVVNWVLSALVNYVVMRAFDLPLPVAAAVFQMVVINLGMIVPSAPGYVGVFEGLSVVALTPYGIDATQALAYALALHTVVYGTFIVVGLWFVWRGGYHLRELWSGRREGEATPAETHAAVRAPELVAVPAPPERSV
jgi:glycosyltransferase 2 family protein